MTAPLIFKNPNTGGTQEKRLYARHGVLSGPDADSSLGVVIDPVDLAGSDESTWMFLAPDSSGSPGTYGAASASLSLGNISVGQIVPFWLKLVVPANNESGPRDDLALKLTATTTNLKVSLDISSGTTSKFTYVAGTGLFLDGDLGYGYWISPWMNTTFSAITGMEIVSTGSAVISSYRTSTNGTDATATAWVNNPADVPAASYIQVRLEVTPGFAATEGLAHTWYSDSTWTTLVNSDINIPYGITPLFDSEKWVGFFKAPTAGTYNFYASVDDLWYLTIGNVVYVNGSGTSSVNVNLTAGNHVIEYKYKNTGGGRALAAYITPPSQIQRPVAFSDFYNDVGVYADTAITSAKLIYRGTNAGTNFDIRVYNGPDTPTLISPTNGFTTTDFNPPLTAMAVNCDAIQFQLDNVVTFDSSYLQSWEAAATGGIPVTSQSPNFDRPAGIWYWRARAKLNGIYSAWTDYRIITILPFSTNPQFIYLNTQIGIEAHDSQVDNRFITLNVNIGETHDSILDNRYLYLNTNIDLGIGQIIYPIQDNTPTRKEDFTEDSEAF
jgi:hypothetical protein